MNYCRECGNKLNENGVFCPNCGVRYSVVSEKNNKVHKKTNGLSIIGLILGILSTMFSMWGIISILAIIISSISRKQIMENGEAGENFAVTGLCCGVLSLLMLVVIWEISSCA